MLLRAKVDYGYAGMGIGKNGIYIGYALHENATLREVAVYALSPETDAINSEVNPLYFPFGKFEVLADEFSESWTTRIITGSNGDVYQSFPEFFNVEGFWARLHDWDLDGEDFNVIQKYKKLYERRYTRLIEENKLVDHKFSS